MDGSPAHSNILNALLYKIRLAISPATAEKGSGGDKPRPKHCPVGNFQTGFKTNHTNPPAHLPHPLVSPPGLKVQKTPE
jgi:hypothetical protein